MNDLLDKWKKTWLDLYSIDYDSYPSFNDFKRHFSSLYDKYIELSKQPDFKYPPLSDLEEVYKQCGYNMRFWDNPVNNCMEF